MRRILVTTTLLVLAACRGPELPPQAVSAAPSAPHAPAEHAKGEHACGAETTALTDDRVTTRQDERGQAVTHVGAALSDAAPVTVSDLLASPDAFAGKRVRLKGDVTAMCQHKRAWFALVAEDQSGRTVRVLTTPSFLVPPGSIGKTAEAEGVVEVLELAAEQAQHLAGEHKLGDPAAVAGSVKQVVVRATGADFI
ncbi:MAG: DUF4920 domain-containing protein [Deltaproteobacteria bacterium]|nr:DUF4920 domain-containing protein [Deltaproteobacteria bacterium]